MPSLAHETAYAPDVLDAYNLLRSDPRAHAFFKDHWGVDPFDQFQNITWQRKVPGESAHYTPGGLFSGEWPTWLFRDQITVTGVAFQSQQYLVETLMHELTHLASLSQLAYRYAFRTAHDPGPGSTAAAETLADEIWSTRGCSEVLH